MILTPPATGVSDSPLWLQQVVRLLVFLFPVMVATTSLGSELMLLLLLPALYFGRGWSVLEKREKRLLLGFAVMFAVMSLSLLNAEELYEGVKALDRYFRFALLIPLYLMFRRFGFAFGRELALGAVIGTVLMFAQSLYQVYWQAQPLAQGAYHKIVFGDLAVWWATVAALLAVTVVREWRYRVILLMAILMALVASVLSLTRGAWLFIPVFPLILIWAQWGKAKRMRKWVVAGATAGLALLVVAATQTDQLREGFHRGINELELFFQQPEAQTSWGIRLNLWRNSLLILQDTPLLGTGVGDFKADMQRMVEDGSSWNPYVAEFDHAHSIYFDTLAKGGILGFVVTTVALLLMPLFTFIKALRRAEQDWERFYALGGVLLIAAFATFGLSEGLWARNPFVNTYIICLVVFMTGLMNTRKQADDEADRRLQGID